MNQASINPDSDSQELTIGPDGSVTNIGDQAVEAISVPELVVPSEPQEKAESLDHAVPKPAPAEPDIKLQPGEIHVDEQGNVIQG
jgi:hypothetical protein